MKVMGMNKTIFMRIGIILGLIFFIGGIFWYFHGPQKYYRKDFKSQFNVRYLETPEIDAAEIYFCDPREDQFFKDNEDNCQTLSAIYGELIDKQYVAPVYIQYVNERVGHGLFADTLIQKGEMIGEYTGILLHESKVSSNNAYLFYYPSKLTDDPKIDYEFYVDAEKAGNYTRFANHARPSNAERRYVPHKGLWRVIFVAVKDIAKDEQIFIDYGAGYWGDREPIDLLNE